MKKDIKNFVETYNKNMSWNKDILNNIDIDFFNKNEETKKIIEEYLPIKTIESERYDLENAKLYNLSYIPGILELQAYSYRVNLRRENGGKSSPGSARPLPWHCGL